MRFKNHQKIVSIDLGKYQNVILVFFDHFFMLSKAKIYFREIRDQFRAPGSLSDRWSSLATIYPLRFHEIFGRWLSHNIKWQNQTSVSVFDAEMLRFDELCEFAN